MGSDALSWGDRFEVEGVGLVFALSGAKTTRVGWEPLFPSQRPLLGARPGGASGVSMVSCEGVCASSSRVRGTVGCDVVHAGDVSSLLGRDDRGTLVWRPPGGERVPPI